MPAPVASQLEPIARGALQSAGIRGENAPDLAKALTRATADALNLFFALSMVMPGIGAAVDPNTGSGSTAGPGIFVPPPAGGPIGAQLAGPTQAALNANNILGANAPSLAMVISEALAQGILLFTAQVQVPAGVAVAGFVTAAPAPLA